MGHRPRRGGQGDRAGDAALIPDLADTAAPRSRVTSLTDRQRAVYDVISRYYKAVGEPCPASIVARRLKIQYTTARTHFTALARKGWLDRDITPATPRRSFLGRY